MTDFRQESVIVLRRTTRKVVMMMVGEIVAKARRNSHNPRGKARSNDLTSMTPIGLTVGGPEIVATR